jgi:hypothetical protein
MVSARVKFAAAITNTTIANPPFILPSLKIVVETFSLIRTNTDFFKDKAPY